jgi:hypothetical protein
MKSRQTDQWEKKGLTITSPSDAAEVKELGVSSAFMVLEMAKNQRASSHFLSHSFSGCVA